MGRLTCTTYSHHTAQWEIHELNNIISLHTNTNQLAISYMYLKHKRIRAQLLGINMAMTHTTVSVNTNRIAAQLKILRSLHRSEGMGPPD